VTRFDFYNDLKCRLELAKHRPAHLGHSSSRCDAPPNTNLLEVAIFVIAVAVIANGNYFFTHEANGN